MLPGIIGFIVTVGIYWLLWRIWLSVAPNLISDVEYQFIVKPKFWQFAIALFVVLFLFRKPK